MTRHEAVARALRGAVEVALAGAGLPEVTRAPVLPEFCPEAGLVNLRYEDPEQTGHRLGAGVREWRRICSVEIVVQANDDDLRRERFDAVLVALGPLRGAAGGGGLIDFIEVSAPVEVEDAALESDSPVLAGVVEIEMFYETGENPLEEHTP